MDEILMYTIKRITIQNIFTIENNTLVQYGHVEFIWVSYIIYILIMDNSD